MDDFATLARDFGFRPHGKSAPMTASGAKIGVGTDAGDRVSSAAFLDKGNRDGFLFNNVIGGPTKISTANYTISKSASTLSDLDYDSIFKNSSSTTAVEKAKNGSSSPVYDKPVYDEDIFDGLPGLKSKSTSFSVNFENVFAGLSPPKSQHRSAGFNDLHENFDRTAKSDAQSQKSTAGLDDLLPGFGGTSSASSRPHSESNGMLSTAKSTKPIPTAAEDPFVVIGSTSKSRVSSPDMFTNPHDVMDKIGHSGKTEVKDSFNGGVFESIDFLNGFGKSVPTFPSEMNTGYRMSTEHNSSDSEPIRRSQFNGPESHFQKKMPYDNFQDPYQTIFEVPGDSLDSHKFDIQTSSSYVYPNYDVDATSTSEAHAEPSVEVWLSVSDFPIVTQVTRAPPPSRPPPPIPFRYAKEVRVKEYTKTSRTKEAAQLEKDEQTIHDDQERKYREMQERLESEQRQSEEEEKKLRRLEEEKKQRRLEEEKEQRRLEEEKEQRKVEEEKEQRRLEKERERAREIAREREMGRQAVERATREARERAAIEARERAAAEVRQKAERTAVQRVQAEARERATVEARERAEKAVAEARERSNAEAREKETREKAEARERAAVARAEAEARERAAVARAEAEASERAAAEARQKAERSAVQRVQAEARERAGRAAVEARDRENAGAREKEIREKAAVARAEARQRAERAAVDRVAAEARERAAADARERAAAKMGQQKNDNDLDAFFSAGRASSAPRPTTNSRENSTFQSKGAPEVARTSSVSASSNTRKTSSTTNIIDDLSSIFGAAPTTGGFDEVEGESEERRRARLERQQRTQERTAKALAEKNQRDLQTLREQEERHRFAETLDFEIKRWAAGKEGNLRALLSTLHYVLWPECGWQPVSLTDLIMGASVKKFYRKATLCIHPDKVQQKGATLQQKYIAEKIFDILKEAWNKFNSEELF